MLICFSTSAFLRNLALIIPFSAF